MDSLAAGSAAACCLRDSVARRVRRKMERKRSCRRPMFGSGDDIAESVFCQKNKSRSLDVNGKVGYKVLTELDLQAVQSGRSPDPKDD